MSGQFESLQRQDLRIMLLGPGEVQRAHYEKRLSIKERLRDRGYLRADTGEQILGPSPELPLHLALARALRNVDLILVLETGPAPLVELTQLSNSYRARQITRVWCLREHVAGRRSAPSDVVKMFDHWLFNQDEFDSCELTDEFLLAADRFCLNKAQLTGRLQDMGLAPPAQ